MGVQFMTTIKSKLISNRELFRQLLARDILAVLREWNGGTAMRLIDVRAQLHSMSAARHYMNLHTSMGHCYTSYTDRFFRAVQSINDAGYGVVIKKHSNGQLWAFNTDVLQHDNWQNFLAECSFTNWTTDYSSNRGYERNTQLDEVA
jgi:hypothetical protein